MFRDARASWLHVAMCDYFYVGDMDDDGMIDLLEETTDSWLDELDWVAPGTIACRQEFLDKVCTLLEATMKKEEEKDGKYYRVKDEIKNINDEHDRINRHCDDNIKYKQNRVKAEHNDVNDLNNFIDRPHEDDIKDKHDHIKDERYKASNKFKPSETDFNHIQESRDQKKQKQRRKKDKDKMVAAGMCSWRYCDFAESPT